MNRRTFFHRTAGALTAALVGRATWAESSAPSLPSGEMVCWWVDRSTVRNEAGEAFRCVQAQTDLEAHQVVQVDGVPVGVACADIPAGAYGWVKIRGPVLIRVSEVADLAKA